jgi:hypothetical protein
LYLVFFCLFESFLFAVLMDCHLLGGCLDARPAGLIFTAAPKHAFCSCGSFFYFLLRDAGRRPAKLMRAL